MLTTTVRMSSTAPRPITELVARPGLASANWLTIADPRVAPGASREWGMAGRLPMTMATAIASPSARPTARVTAAAMPEPAPGSTAVRIDLPAGSAQGHGRFPVGPGHPGQGGAAQGDHGGQGHDGQDHRGQQNARPEGRAPEQPVQPRQRSTAWARRDLRRRERGRGEPTGRRRCSARRPETR